MLAWDFTVQELAVQRSGFPLSDRWLSVNTDSEDQGRGLESELLGLKVGDQIQDLIFWGWFRV